MYYNRARYYSAKLGRFIWRDPIDIVDDINLYAYVGNNPVMYVDLIGTEKQSLPIQRIKPYEYSLFQKIAIGYTEWYIDFMTTITQSAFYTVHAPWEDINDPIPQTNPTVATQAALIIWGAVWPWKKADLAQEIAEKVTKKWDTFECMECAKELWEAFKKEGIEFETLKLKGWGKYWIYSEKQWDIISTNWYHEAIKVWDNVYDNIHKKWINYHEFLDDLWVWQPWWPNLFK